MRDTEGPKALVESVPHYIRDPSEVLSVRYLRELRVVKHSSIYLDYVPVWGSAFNLTAQRRVFSLSPVLLLSHATRPSKSKLLILLIAVHAGLAVGSFFYYEALRQLNKPTPDKPINRVPEENHVM